jgi:hypothetical protein
MVGGGARSLEDDFGSAAAAVPSRDLDWGFKVCAACLAEIREMVLLDSFSLSRLVFVGRKRGVSC